MSGSSGGMAAGAAFGLAAAIGIGGLFAVHDQWELLTELHHMSLALNQQKQIIIERKEKEQRFEQLRAVNGFYLGYQLAMAVSESTEDQDSFFFVRGLCQELNLPLWPDEWQRLEGQPTNSTELNQIFEMVRSRVQQS